MNNKQIVCSRNPCVCGNGCEGPSRPRWTWINCSECGQHIGTAVPTPKGKMALLGLGIICVKCAMTQEVDVL